MKTAAEFRYQYCGDLSPHQDLIRELLSSLEAREREVEDLKAVCARTYLLVEKMNARIDNFCQEMLKLTVTPESPNP